MYRPQFAYGAPGDRCDGQRCTYSFDGSNTPALVSVAAGALLTKIPLQMDQDAPFLLRAIQVPNTGLRIRIEDCFDNPLLTDQTTTNPALFAESDGAGVVPMDSDDWGIYCPAGATLLLYVYNPTALAITGFVLNLHGEKWYPEGSCS